LDNTVDLTKEVFEIIKREIQLTGFWDSIPARNKLKAEIQRILLSERFNRMPSIIQNRNIIISRIMELAQANSDKILYAE
jgi:type I restriction enzyme R subunit